MHPFEVKLHVMQDVAGVKALSNGAFVRFAASSRRLARALVEEGVDKRSVGSVNALGFL